MQPPTPCSRLSTLFFIIVVVALISSGRSQPAPPATTQLSSAEEQKLERVKINAEVTQLPSKRVDSIRDVLRLRKQDDRLVGEAILVDIEPGAQTHVIVGDLPEAITLRVFETIPLPDEPRDFSFLHRDLASTNTRYTTISSAAGRLTIAREEESDTEYCTAQLIQDPQVPDPDPTDSPLRFFISRENHLTNQREVDLKLNAKNFTELCLKHPREVEQFLRPILRDLKQEAGIFAPETKAAWQVLAADATVDRQVAMKVEQALAKLDAQSFQEREGALSALQELGEPAALVLMRADRSKLSPDKQSGVDSFLAPYLPLSADDAKRLGQDKTFLLNALSADDVELRKLAWARLQKIARPPMSYDPTADDTKRAAQLAALREALVPSTNPTTQENR
jgi:hypothetical protein